MHKFTPTARKLQGKENNMKNIMNSKEKVIILPYTNSRYTMLTYSRFNSIT